MKITFKSVLTLFIIILFLGSTLAYFSSFFGGGENTVKKQIVVMETSKGVIEIELYANNAPITVANFAEYVENGHYDGTVFHRVIPGFMIQGGGFTPDGAKKPTRNPIKLESRTGLKNVRGTISMARTKASDSATSQFFINLVDNAFLDYGPDSDGYAVFGKVVEGMEVVDAIAAVEAGSRGVYEDWPMQDVIIIKAYFKN